MTLVIDGQRHVLRLTLGALAELEAALETDTLVALVQRFEGNGFATGDVLALLQAGLSGGQCNLSPDALLHGQIEGGPMAAARAAAELLARAFMLPE